MKRFPVILNSLVLFVLLAPERISATVPALVNDDSDKKEPARECVYYGIACIQEADTTPLDQRLPLILIHGLNPNGLFASPTPDTWDKFLDYYKKNSALNSAYKPYLFLYYSNILSISDLASKLIEAIDKVGQNDPDNFGGKNVALLCHSMGGLVARNAVILKQSYGVFGEKPLGDRVTKIITLASPHHGSPIANGPARDYRAGAGWGNAIGNFDLLFWFWNLGPRWNEVNRADLRWDNYDGLLNYDLYPDERNLWLENLNQNQAYDSKIFAYGGTTAPGNFCLLDKYCWGTTVLGGVFDLANDGVVPLKSAHFDGHKVITRYFSDYSHSEMAGGKGSADFSLFDKVRDDLLGIERPSDRTEGIIWLSFTTGNPGVPGDGLTVSSACGQFQLNPPLSLKGVSDGLTLSIFPTSTENLFAILDINKSPSSDGPGASMVLTSPPSIITKNGVRGISFNITQSSLQEAVKVVNLLFTNYTLDDLYIVELEITAYPLAPCSYHAPLDAVAIGRGQNVVP